MRMTFSRQSALKHSTMSNKVAPCQKRESNVDEVHRQRYRPQSGISSSALAVQSGECYMVFQSCLLFSKKTSQLLNPRGTFCSSMNIGAMARDGSFCAPCFFSTFPTTPTGLLLLQCNQKPRNSTASIIKVEKVNFFWDFCITSKNPKEVKRICTVSYGLGLPGCVAATVVLSKFGLRVGLYVGATFTVMGGLLCCLSSLSVITDSTPPPVWYWMVVVGQALSGFGSPFISCVPTKVISDPRCDENDNT